MIRITLYPDELPAMTNINGWPFCPVDFSHTSVALKWVSEFAGLQVVPGPRSKPLAQQLFVHDLFVPLSL